jgi:hypothetical protein
LISRRKKDSKKNPENEGCKMGAREPTASENGVKDVKPGRPATTFHNRAPQLLGRLALSEQQGGARPHDQVDRRDHAPEQDLVPPLVGETEERDGEGGLADGHGDDGEELSDVE